MYVIVVKNISMLKKIFGPYRILLMRVREGRRKLVWRLWMAVRVWWREEPSSWPASGTWNGALKLY